MNEACKAILAEWRGGGLERCLQGANYSPRETFKQYGNLAKWRKRLASKFLMADVDFAVSEATGVSIKMLHANRRSKDIARPRQLAMYLMRDLCPDRSLPEIAHHFGKADHTTVIHGIKQSKKLLATDPEFNAAHEQARQILLEMQTTLKTGKRGNRP